MNYDDFHLDYAVAKLSNGLTLAHRYLQIPDVVFVMGVNEGSIHEPKDKRGILHFVEHLFYRSRSGENIKEKLHEITGRDSPHAETSPEQVLFVSRMPVQDFNKFLEMWSQTTLNCCYEPEAFETERRVILNEIASLSKKGTLSHYLMTLRRDKLFPGSVLGLSPGGDPDHVQRITPDDIAFYKRERINASNTCLTVVGGCPFDETVKLLEYHLEGLQAGFSRPVLLEDIPEPLPFEDQKSFDALPHPELLMMFHALGDYELDILPTSILRSYLGSGASSRLMHILREKNGLCYDTSIEATDFSSLNKNAWFVHVSRFDSCNYSRIRKLVEEELDNVKQGRFDLERLERVKQGFVKKFYQNYLQSPTDQAESIDDCVRRQVPYRLEDIVRCWCEISTEELARVAQCAFNGKYVATLCTPK